MEAEFWHERWNANRIAFHESKANPLLVGYFDRLALAQNAKVFVPLCGKTLDIGWLLSQNCRITGAELSEVAVKQLFAELGLTPEIAVIGALKHYSAQNIDIFAGDIFSLTGDMLGPVDAIYDRAALVALPEDMRARYTAHLADLTGTAPQLLITFEYNQSEMAGPPFSVPQEEILRHYEGRYEIALLEGVEVTGGLKGVCAATENISLLTPRRSNG